MIHSITRCCCCLPRQRPTHGNLENWARQGVLMLNTVLTVRAHAPLSHQKQGWETFTGVPPWFQTWLVSQLLRGVCARAAAAAACLPVRRLRCGVTCPERAASPHCVSALGQAGTGKRAHSRGQTRRACALVVKWW